LVALMHNEKLIGQHGSPITSSKLSSTVPKFARHFFRVIFVSYCRILLQNTLRTLMERMADSL
jgi:hypothetical protein